MFDMNRLIVFIIRGFFHIIYITNNCSGSNILSYVTVCEDRNIVKNKFLYERILTTFFAPERMSVIAPHTTRYIGPRTCSAATREGKAFLNKQIRDITKTTCNLFY